jgi:hypothetical protein
MSTQPQAAATAGLSADDRRAIALEAYLYLYPLVTMEVTRRQMTNLEAGQKIGFGPMNQFTHTREFPPADFKAVVRPNFDTLYSITWLNLHDGPKVVTVPDAADRYYLLPLYDMWTDAFAVPGYRTSGTHEQHYAILPPGWQGNLPADVEPIQSPTPIVWVIGRTQTNGPADYDAVHVFQDGMKIRALASWPDEPEAVVADIDAGVDMDTPPLDQVNGMSAKDYFTFASALIGEHPPHITDWSMLARMRRLGIRPGEQFDAAGLDDVPAAAQGVMQNAMPHMATITNGWQMNTDSMGVYGDFYLKRAIVAMMGLGANPVDDALYPINLTDADGVALDGGNDYVLHFEESELPPVDAFWSVTMYDDAGFQAANELDRFAIGDRDDLSFNDDGSLDIYIQNKNPGPERESNWLPAPTGPLGVTMRLYAPRPEALDGRWAPPPIRRV